jgi:predicted AAA+ superfamily ATPase
LDDPDQADLLLLNPRRLMTAPRPVLLDEWQRAPRVWDLVRRAVDGGVPPGTFILTGSATPRERTHSGAGRIVRLRMRPMALSERGVAVPTVGLASLLSGAKPHVDGDSEFALGDYVAQIIRSGFPGVRRAEGRNLERALDGYLARIVEHDFPELGHVVRRPQALEAWMTAFAAATASTASYETILDASTAGSADKPTRATTLAYRDTLTRLWILDQLPAWSPSRNRFAALTQTPKHFLADPALAARLLGVGAEALIDNPRPGKIAPRDGTLLGALFEHLAALTVRVLASPTGARTRHLRTRRGDHEIDLIVERPDGRVLALEAKLAPIPSDRDAAHLLWLRDRLGPDLLDAVILTTGPAAYRRPDGIAVVPLALLGP